MHLQKQMNIHARKNANKHFDLETKNTCSTWHSHTITTIPYTAVFELGLMEELRLENSSIIFFHLLLLCLFVGLRSSSFMLLPIYFNCKFVPFT